LGGSFLFIAAVAQAADMVYVQWDFEAGPGTFQSSTAPGTDGWEWGTPTYPAGLSAHSGSKLWGTNLSTELLDYNTSYELSIGLSLPPSPDAGLFVRWWDWFGADGGDVREVVIQDLGGKTTVWNFSGTSQAYWQYQQADISQWADTYVLIIFKLSTCCQPPGIDGWYIDDVSIVGGAYPLWDFEADDGGFFAHLSGDWEWGLPTYPPELTAAHSGIRLWGTNLDGPALEGGGVFVDHDLRREIGVHPGGAVLRWWDWNKAEDLVDVRSVNVDLGSVETELMSRRGNQLEWKLHQVDLSPWAGERIGVVFRLSGCCAAPGPDGWYIDDLQLMPTGIFDGGFESGNLTAWSSSVP